MKAFMAQHICCK